MQTNRFISVFEILPSSLSLNLFTLFWFTYLAHHLCIKLILLYCWEYCNLDKTDVHIFVLFTIALVMENKYRYRYESGSRLFSDFVIPNSAVDP